MNKKDSKIPAFSQPDDLGFSILPNQRTFQSQPCPRSFPNLTITFQQFHDPIKVQPEVF